MKFYTLELKRQELWKDILLNLVTNVVLCKNVYFVVYNLLTKKLYKRICNIQDKIERLQNIMPEDLGVSKILAMNLSLRKEIIPKPRPKICKPFLPFQNTINNLFKLRNTESLILKLEFMFRLFTGMLTNELHQFWDKYISYDKMFVDADSLKALMIYIIIKAKSAKLLVDVIFIEEFTPESVKYTNRSYYMTVFHSAFEYLEDITDKRFTDLLDTINSRVSSEKDIEYSDDEM